MTLFVSYEKSGKAALRTTFSCTVFPVLINTFNNAKLVETLSQQLFTELDYVFEESLKLASIHVAIKKLHLKM